MSDQFMQVYIDFLPNQPKTELAREDFKELLTGRFNHKLPDAVERIWELPPLMLHDPSGDYLELLVEARDLFVAGHFYSCVAMCGIVGERLVKNVFRASILVQSPNGAMAPTEAALDSFERSDVSGIVAFLHKAALLGDEGWKAAKNLAEMRNKYAHARGKNPHEDAIKSIKLLHTLVEDTVSVFKTFEIKGGMLVHKDEPQSPA